MPDSGARDALERWAAQRAPDLLARAEAEAVALLRDALVAASVAHADAEAPRHRTVSRAKANPNQADPTEERQAAEPPPPTPHDARELLWAYCVLRDDDDPV